MSEVVLGIDIGGTNTVYGLVDSKGNCIYQSKMDTDSQKDEVDYFKRLLSKIERTKAEFSSQYKIKGIGIGAPNANYYTGKVENPPNLNWKTVNVVEIIKQNANLPAAITNDANAAAMGEKKFGAAVDMKNFIEITLGTGLGSGVFVDGNLVYGNDGFAGELGHIIVQPNGRKCGCGRRGCLETYASATGIKRTFVELLSLENKQSLLNGISFAELDAKMIYDAAMQGDEVSKKAFEYTASILGAALANVVTVTSPEAFILFGGLAAAGDLLLKPTKKAMEENLLNIFKNKVEILPSKLDGSVSAILGASAIIWNELNMMN